MSQARRPIARRSPSRRAASAACRRRRLLPSSATCGLWAHTSREARACARRLRGLNHLLLSTDRFHLEFIDLHDVIRAMEACVAEGINTSVNYVAEADEFTGADCIPTELTKAARRLGVGIVVTPCSAAGRAASAQNLVVPIAPSMPCGKLDVPLFDCMGNAFACGPGWTIPGEGDSRWELGRFPQRALNDLFHRAYSSPIFHGLRNLGPLATERRIAEENGTPSDRLGLEPLSSPCGTCQRIARSFSAGARFAGSTGAPCSIPSRNS